MEELDNRKILMTRMDDAFGDYSHEAEKLSVLLAERRDRFTWVLPNPKNKKEQEHNASEVQREWATYREVHIPSRMRGVDPATVHERQLKLPQ